jgi:hypothetical protein
VPNRHGYVADQVSEFGDIYPRRREGIRKTEWKDRSKNVS